MRKPDCSCEENQLSGAWEGEGYLAKSSKVDLQVVGKGWWEDSRLPLKLEAELSPTFFLLPPPPSLLVLV